MLERLGLCFERIGFDDRLAKAGCEPGDEVRILGYAFSYEGERDDDFADLDEEDETLDEGGDL